jgi:branched-chain amino acid transport system permease protein
MDQLIGSIIFVVLYGGTYGAVLFIISVGLVMTLGLMRVPNLAHGAFAAIGGYAAALLMNRVGFNYYFAVGGATVLVAVLGAVVERTIYVRLYKMPELDQILLTLGLTFVVIGALALVFGPNVFAFRLPPSLSNSVDILGRSFPVYRIFLLAAGAVLIAIFWLVFDKTNFGARLRAAVDNRSMAQATGINTDRIVMVAFAAGTGLAAFGGAIGAGLFPLEPLYPIKYLTIILIIVAMSGFGNIKSSIAVAIVVGLVDTAARYALPETGGFAIYALVILAVSLRPAGLFARQDF